jgi:hypothetical protein
MLQRIGLFVATLAAALVVVIGIVAATPSSGAPTASTPASAIENRATMEPTEPPVQVDTIYLPARIPPKTITIHRNVAPASGGDDGETEDEGD